MDPEPVVRHYCLRSQQIDLERIGDKQSEHMPALLLSIFRFVRLLLSGHQAIAIHNAALRLQLAAFQRKRKRPVLTFDRVCWITLRRWWSGWPRPLCYVQADTVARWQRERFRRFWARLSKRHGRRRGRPAIAVEIRLLIERMVVANPWWGAPRIHGELKMLGIAISPLYREFCGGFAASHSDVEDLPSQPSRKCIHRFLYGSDDHHSGAIRVHRAGSFALEHMTHVALEFGVFLSTSTFGFCAKLAEELS
jgi:hypothetical protein